MDWNALGDWIWGSLERLSVVAPLGALLAVVVAYYSYRGTLRQRTLADNRNAWWNRVQWAIDAAVSRDEQRRATGLAAVEQMQDSELATKADQELLAAMADAVLDETLELLAIDYVSGFTAGTDAADYDEGGAMTPSTGPSNRYQVTLNSRDGKVLYAKTLTQKRILESAERIIAKANQKIAK